MKILVTGGCGYIGSHTIVELLENNYEVLCVDNFCNSKREVIDEIKKITNKDFTFYEGDICSKKLLRQIFAKNNIDCVIHFAGYKAVGESVSNPLKYYDNNLISTISLLEVMEEYSCKNLIFSSSATVYGSPKSLPITEDFPTSTTNPYGTTKFFIEKILTDLYSSNNSWNITILRYFNPIGAHESGLIGENPNDIPNNLMPYIAKVASGELPKINIFGNDYDTVDGTGVRDYIHVVDLARGHVLALKKLNNLNIFNLGTGHGTSVLQLIKTFESVNNVKVPYQFVERRPGDIGSCYTSCTKAKNGLGFETSKTIEDMCKDAFAFIVKKQ